MLVYKSFITGPLIEHTHAPIEWRGYSTLAGKIGPYETPLTISGIPREMQILNKCTHPNSIKMIVTGLVLIKQEGALVISKDLTT